MKQFESKNILMTYELYLDNDLVHRVTLNLSTPQNSYPLLFMQQES